MGLKETDCSDMNCFVLTQDMVKCKAVVDKVINNVSLSEGIERRDRMLFCILGILG
jgi:hypothetical protein